MKQHFFIILFLLSYFLSPVVLNDNASTDNNNLTDINTTTFAPESSTPSQITKVVESTPSGIDTPSQATTPRVTTTITLPTSVSTKRPKTKELGLILCPCDILLSKCDFNCCCDKECTDDDRKLFFSCTDIEKGSKRSAVSDKYCIRKEFLFRDNTPYEKTITDKGLFCILTDNSKQESILKLPKNLDKLQDTPKYTWSAHPISQSTSTSKRNIYKSRIEILPKNETESKIMHFELPSLFYEKCVSLQPVQFLENFETHCPNSVQNLGQECEQLKALNVKTYIGHFYVIGNPSLSKSINLTSWNPNLLNASYFQCDESSKVCRSTQILKQPELDGKQGLCKNILKKLEITIVHNGTQGIISVSANITYKNYSVLETMPEKFNQEFKVNFKWSESRVIEDIPVSGLPGYIIGKPLIVGIPSPKPQLQTNISSSEIEEETENKTVQSLSSKILQKDALTGWYLSVPHPSDCGGSRKNVQFGMDIATMCFLNISNYKSCQELQVAIGKVLLGTEPKKFNPRYVSSYGIPDFGNLENWVEIVSSEQPFGVDHTSSFTLLDNGCGGIVTNLKIKVLHGLSGSVQFPQPRVAGVLYAYGDPIKLPKKSDRRTSKIQLTTTVQFYDVTGKTTTVIPKWPVITIKLPSDFFYPFSSIGTKTAKTFKSLIMLCVFAASKLIKIY